MCLVHYRICSRFELLVSSWEMISVYIYTKYECTTFILLVVDYNSWFVSASCVVIAHVSGAALYGESIHFTLNFYLLFSGISNHLCAPRSLSSRFVGGKKNPL